MSKTMLILEDDVVNRDLLRLVFEYEGFTCMEAENGEVGLSMLESQTFDIIILDNAMPGLTGLEILDHLKLQPHQQTDVPIIMITGELNPQVSETAMKLGAYVVVGKPYDLGALRALVSQLSARIPSQPLERSLLPK